MVFLSSPSFADQLGLDIHIRTTIQGRYSFIENAALRIGDSVVEVSRYGDYIVDGVDTVTLPMELAPGYTLRYKNRKGARDVHHFLVDIRDTGKQIRIQSYKHIVAVKIDEATSDDFGDSVGLMGEFVTGRWLGRDGVTVIDNPDDFGMEWQVREGHDAFLFEGKRFPHYPTKCMMPDPVSENRRHRRLGETLFRDAAVKACSEVEDGSFREMCIDDVLATGDLGLATSGVY